MTKKQRERRERFKKWLVEKDGELFDQGLSDCQAARKAGRELRTWTTGPYLARLLHELRVSGQPIRWTGGAKPVIHQGMAYTAGEWGALERALRRAAPDIVGLPPGAVARMFIEAGRLPFCVPAIAGMMRLLKLSKRGQAEPAASDGKLQI